MPDTEVCVGVAAINSSGAQASTQTSLEPSPGFCLIDGDPVRGCGGLRSGGPGQGLDLRFSRPPLIPPSSVRPPRVQGEVR